MFDFLFEIIVLIFLVTQAFLITVWYEEHKTLMQIIAHHLVEIKKKIQLQESKKE